MKSYFYVLTGIIARELEAGETYIAGIKGETSDFVRLNQVAVRQNGHVNQAYLTIALIKDNRKAEHTLVISANPDEDRAGIVDTIARLRARISDLPVDPFLLYSTDVNCSENEPPNTLCETPGILEAILATTKGRDLVGILAAGRIYQGFANSFGQRNWHQVHSYNFDACLYYSGDKAVSFLDAGFKWDPARFEDKIATAISQLEIMQRDPITIPPGQYRVYLAPAALAGLINMLGMRGFGLRDHRTKNSCLNRMIQGEATMHPAVTIRENTARGVAAGFQDDGYLKPEVVDLIVDGALGDPLVSPRSAREYDTACNGAEGNEAPQSIEMLPGDLTADRILESLGTGLYLNNLHYLNYSDLNAARITGLTRYAAFWVEKGAIQAPVNVMRFDDTLFNVFGENLEAITGEREYLLSSSTYFRRSTGSQHLPGLIARNFRLTL